MNNDGFLSPEPVPMSAKTVVASWILTHLGTDYWKPVQCGTDEIDLQTVKRITGLSADHFHPCTYELQTPFAPFEAAKRMGISLDPSRFILPQGRRPLLAEGAGGLLVPITDKFLVIDLIQKLELPAILVSSSKLGTINHTLLSLEALRARNIPIAGVVMNGPLMPHNRQAIEFHGNVPILAEIPQMENITAETLREIKPHIPFAKWAFAPAQQAAA